MPAVTTGMLLVFGLIAVALVLFVTEPVSPDITAISVIVALVALQPWTGVDSTRAISGFASPATVTIVAMYMLSEGVQRTGIVQRLGAHLAQVTQGKEGRMLAATVGTTGPIAGIINNTPVVAVFVPMITDLAEDSGISPSKLLLPLSYAAMLGGTLTLLGTSTNLLASALSRDLLDHPIGMFEFTPLGIVVFLVGAAYLLTVAPRLIPERVKPGIDLTEEFELEDHLSRVVVREDSPLVGLPVEEAVAAGEDIDLVQLVRDEEAHPAPETAELQPGDTLTLHASLRAVNTFTEEHGLRQLPREEVTAEDLEADETGQTLVEAVIPMDSAFVGETVTEAKLGERFDTTVLAVRREEEVHRADLAEFQLAAGDTLLLQTSTSSIEFLAEEGDLIPTQGIFETPAEDEELDEATPLSPKTPIALGIMAAVVLVATLTPLPIVIAALGGVVGMVATGCLTPADAYDAVSWNVIFLLAGVLPLKVAMEATGGAGFLASLLVQSADILPIIAVLGLFYILTGLLANVITPVASVVLLIPIAVDTAMRIGAEPFTFLLAVMFAGSTAFMTPIGYQTNLMVYGPGGYTFGDYVRVGAPLQLLLAVVTTVGLAVMWGV